MLRLILTTRRAKRISTIWLHLMLGTTNDVKLPGLALPLLPRIEKAAATLCAVSTLNRMVHMAHYNSLISEAFSK